ncbi:MAG TPA: glycerol-3-phosphate 1-O-acyltransferase PlsY [Chloroflexota bacterium]
MTDLASHLVPYVLIALAGYLIGSIPTGPIVARVYANVDLTRVGSERTGATNAMRTLGVGAGIVVLVLDFAKGMAAVALAKAVMDNPTTEGLTWLFAVAGHVRSLFLQGRGGRGVVTGLGGLALISPIIFAAAVSSGCLVVAVTRFVSAGSLTGTMMTAILGTAAIATNRLDLALLPFFLVAPSVVVWAHTDNIKRLRNGTERKLSGASPAASG